MNIFELYNSLLENSLIDILTGFADSMIEYNVTLYKFIDI